MFERLWKLVRGGESLPTDPLKLTQQAESGDVKAQYELGKYYYPISGHPHNNYEKAFYWFYKAAAQGHVESQYYVGQMYDTGRGVEKDSTRAIIFFSKAAHQGHAASQFDLAIMYKNGEGVKRDLQKAKMWFEKAARQGHEQAKKWAEHNFHE